MNILYAGTPEPSARILQHLVSNSKYNVVGVLTQPDKPQKRGKKIASSPVSDMAKNHKVQIFKPSDLNEKAFSRKDILFKDRSSHSCGLWKNSSEMAT